MAADGSNVLVVYFSATGTTETLADGGQWLDGERLKSGSSRDDMVSWVNSLGLPMLAE